MSSAADVANWMFEQLSGRREIYQDDIAWKIKRLFGNEFVYENLNGNLAISKIVLKIFRQVTGDAVIWERGSRRWRNRTAQDLPGRQQQ